MSVPGGCPVPGFYLRYHFFIGFGFFKDMLWRIPVSHLPLKMDKAE
jgi:hypothetical protein